MKLISILILFLSLAAAAAIEDTSNFSTEYKKAKNEALGMSERWSALQKASDLASGEDFSKIVAFADSKDWYMRNASLIALDKSGNGMVYDQAKKLITDKALVVRSAAADILARLNNDDVKKIFSMEMDKKYNFSGRSSLWIRKQMMSHLIQNPVKADRDFFMKYLSDDDQEIALLSTKALEKITDIRFEGKNTGEVIQQWKDVAKTQRW